MGRRRHKRWIAGSVVGGVGAAIAVAAWTQWLPSLVIRRAIDAARARGFQGVTIDDAHVGWSSLVLEGVRYAGTATEVRASIVRLRSGPLGWARGVAGVEGIDVAEIEVRVELGRWRSRSPADGASAGLGGLPLRLDRVRVEVRDDQEVLATGTIDRVERTDGAWALSGGGLSISAADVGRGPGDRLELGDIEAQLERDDRGWAVRGLRIGHAEVAIARRAGDPVAGALRGRIRRLLGGGRETGVEDRGPVAGVGDGTLADTDGMLDIDVDSADEGGRASGRRGERRGADRGRRASAGGDVAVAGGRRAIVFGPQEAGRAPDIEGDRPHGTRPTSGELGAHRGVARGGGPFAAAGRAPAAGGVAAAASGQPGGGGGAVTALMGGDPEAAGSGQQGGGVGASDGAPVPVPSGTGPAGVAAAASGLARPDERVEGRAVGHAEGSGVRLGDGARIRFDDVDLWTQGDGGGREDLLSDLSLVIEAMSGGGVRTRGEGRASTGGAVRWDLEVDPDALRASGSVGFHDLPLALVTPLLPEVPWYQAERGRLDADLRIVGEGLERVALEGRLAFRDAAFSSARVAPGPVRGISFVVQGRGVFVPARRRLEIDEGRLEVGRAFATVQGALEWAPEHYLFDVTAVLPPTACGVAVDAIPQDLLAELRGFSVTGQMSARARVLVDSRQLDASRVEVRVQDACEFVTVPAAADLRRFDGPFVHRVLEPDGSTFEMQTGPGTAAWVPIERVSPFLIHAVLAHEDGGFFRHHGFAPSEIQTALVRNLKAGRYVQGASTITMQLVKNVFLHREKTLARKVQEALLTWWIERVFDKRRILELYLNVIEYGPGVYGIRQASQHYFGREPAELTVAQAGFLAMILPSPKSFQEMYESGTLSARFADRVRAFVRRMEAKGRIDRAALEDGLAELDRFAFHRPGAELPPPRRPVGTAQPLPFETYVGDDDGWAGVDEETAREAQRWLEYEDAR